MSEQDAEGVSHLAVVVSLSLVRSLDHSFLIMLVAARSSVVSSSPIESLTPSFVILLAAAHA